MSEIILFTKEDLGIVVQQVIRAELDANEKRRARLESPKLFTINAVARRLGKHFSTIKKLCENGTIKTTKSGLILEEEIERYLGNS